MLNLFTVLAEVAATDPAANPLSSFSMLIPLILMLVAFWFLLVRPQRKKEKQDAEMRKNVQIGDMIVTAGGIVGIVVKLEEDCVVVETTSDKTKMRFRRWAISENLSAKEENAAKAAAKKNPNKEEEIGIEK